MKKVCKWIEENFEKWFLIISLIVMVVLIFVQVLLRLTGKSIVWIEELARYIMLYQIWIGAAYAVKEDAHIRISSFKNRFKGKSKVRLELIVLTIWLIFSVWLIGEGCILVQEISKMGQRSPAMRLPMVVPYLSVPIGGLLMSIRLVQKLKVYLVKLKEGEL